MKKLYFLDESEKERILNLHESHTKKQYLMNEQSVGSALYAGASGAAKGAAIGALGGNPITIAAGAVIGGAVGLISSISSGISREGFNNTITQICSTGAGKPTLNSGKLMDIAKKLNDLINTTNYLGGGYATTQSRAGIKETLSTIPTIPDLCGVMVKYKDIYNIDLLADLRREIYYDSYWTDTVKFPLMKAVEASKEATAKAQEQKPGETPNDFTKDYPCVLNFAKAVNTSDGKLAYYESKTFHYYGGGRRKEIQTGEMSDYYCGPDGSIKAGKNPNATTVVDGGSTVTAGGGLGTRVSTIQKQLGLTQSGKMDQATINALMTKIQGGGSSATTTTPQPKGLQ